MTENEVVGGRSYSWFIKEISFKMIQKKKEEKGKKEKEKKKDKPVSKQHPTRPRT